MNSRFQLLDAGAGPLQAAVHLPNCRRIDPDQVIGTALGAYWMSFLLPLEAAGDGVGWMMNIGNHPIALLRNAITPHSVPAAARAVRSHRRSHTSRGRGSSKRKGGRDAKSKAAS